MNEALISSILSEVKGECNIPSSYSDLVLTTFIKEGHFDITSKVNDLIDFESDHSARALLKTFVRYSYYGQRDLFRQRYDSEYLDLQIRYINV